MYFRLWKQTPMYWQWTLPHTLLGAANAQVAGEAVTLPRQTVRLVASSLNAEHSSIQLDAGRQANHLCLVCLALILLHLK